MLILDDDRGDASAVDSSPEELEDHTSGRGDRGDRGDSLLDRARRISGRWASRYTFAGVATGWLFLALSLTPSLLPRPALLQGILSGIAAAFGYGVGAGVAKLWTYLGLPVPSEERIRPVRRVVYVILGVVLVWFLFQLSRWDSTLRDLFQMEPVNEPAQAITVLVVALVVATLLIGLARLVAKPVRALIHFAERQLPPRLGRVLGFTIGILLVVVLTDGLLVAPLVSAASSAFSVSDRGTDPGVTKPTSSLRSGGPESLVPWDSLGRQGRKWVSQGPTAENINAFSGGGATEPIRVYVGLDSADSPEGRAQLALEELIRTGAFGRDAIVIATSTGSGGIDPKGPSPVEYIHNGNTALVAMQYSYLPSALSLFVDAEAAKQNSQDFLETIHAHWRNLDSDTRPRLYLWGLSLGSFGSESSARSIRLVAEPVDGAVWAGPTFLNEDWLTIADNRDAGSPAWLPIYDNGSVVRFTGRENSLDEPSGEWADNRFVYLQHPSDPVSFFSFDLMYRTPEWLKGERSPEMSPDMRWYPGVTFWQVVMDLPIGVSTPPGYGHNYAASTYVDAWAAVTQADDWTQEKADRLAQIIAELGS